MSIHITYKNNITLFLPHLVLLRKNSMNYYHNLLLKWLYKPCNRGVRACWLSLQSLLIYPAFWIYNVNMILSVILTFFSLTFCSESCKWSYKWLQRQKESEISPFIKHVLSYFYFYFFLSHNRGHYGINSPAALRLDLFFFYPFGFFCSLIK